MRSVPAAAHRLATPSDRQTWRSGGDPLRHLPQAASPRGAASGCLLRVSLLARHAVLGTAVARFVILGVLIDVPDVVVLLAREDVSRNEHQRHHRMVLVVVFVHPVTVHQV